MTYTDYWYQPSEYADVSTVWDGALDDTTTIYTESDIAEYIDRVRFAKPDVPVEVYVLWHSHPEYDEADNEYDECACSQFVTDHNPTARFGPTWEQVAERDKMVAQDKLDIERMEYEMA